MSDDIEFARIKAKVKHIALSHTRKMTNEEIDSWATKLRQYAGPILSRVLDGFSVSDDFPNVGMIIGKYFAEISAGSRTQTPKSLTPAERRKADHAAILAMLNLHYDFGWRFENFGGDLLRRVFADLIGPGKTITEMLEQAKKHYTPEKVRELLAGIERDAERDS